MKIFRDLSRKKKIVIGIMIIVILLITFIGIIIIKKNNHSFPLEGKWMAYSTEINGKEELHNKIDDIQPVIVIKNEKNKLSIQCYGGDGTFTVKVNENLEITDHLDNKILFEKKEKSFTGKYDIEGEWESIYTVFSEDSKHPITDKEEKYILRIKVEDEKKLEFTMIKGGQEKTIIIEIIDGFLHYIVKGEDGYAKYKKFDKGDFILKDNRMNVEYGKELNKEDFIVKELTEKSALDKLEMDTSNIKMEDGKSYPKCGTYDVTFKNGEITKRIKLTVEDTTKPKFEKSKDIVKVEMNKKPTQEELENMFSVSDLSGIKNIYLSDDVNYSILGEQKATILAEDNYGNKTEKDVTIKIVYKFDKENISINSTDEAIEYLKQALASKNYPYNEFFYERTHNNMYIIRATSKKVQDWIYQVTKDGKIYSGYECVLSPYSNTCTVPVDSNQKAKEILNETKHFQEIKKRYDKSAIEKHGKKLEMLYYISKTIGPGFGYEVEVRYDNSEYSGGHMTLVGRYFVSPAGEVFEEDIYGSSTPIE